MLKTGKATEKSNFAQTCNLLSQYVKERGRMDDISRGMNRKLEPKGVLSFSISVSFYLLFLYIVFFLYLPYLFM